MLPPSDWRSSFDHALGTAPMLTSFFSNMPFLPRGRWSSEDPMSLLDWRPVGHGSLVDPRPRSGKPWPPVALMCCLPPVMMPPPGDDIQRLLFGEVVVAGVPFARQQGHHHLADALDIADP